MFRVPDMGPSFLDSAPPAGASTPNPVADSEAQVAIGWSADGQSPAHVEPDALQQHHDDAPVERTWADLHAHTVCASPEASAFWPKLDPVVHASNCGKPGAGLDAGRRGVELYVSVDAGDTFSATGQRFTFFSQTMLVQGTCSATAHCVPHADYISHVCKRIPACHARCVPGFLPSTWWHSTSYLRGRHAWRRSLRRSGGALRQAPAQSCTVIADEGPGAHRARQQCRFDGTPQLDALGFHHRPIAARTKEAAVQWWDRPSSVGLPVDTWRGLEHFVTAAASHGSDTARGP